MARPVTRWVDPALGYPVPAGEVGPLDAAVRQEVEAVHAALLDAGGAGQALVLGAADQRDLVVVDVVSAYERERGAAGRQEQERGDGEREPQCPF